MNTNGQKRLVSKFKQVKTTDKREGTNDARTVVERKQINISSTDKNAKYFISSVSYSH